MGADVLALPGPSYLAPATPRKGLCRGQGGGGTCSQGGSQPTTIQLGPAAEGRVGGRLPSPTL